MVILEAREGGTGSALRTTRITDTMPNDQSQMWEPLDTPPDGFPEASRMRTEPIVEELQKLKQMADGLETVDLDDPKAKAFRFVYKRIRARVWEGTKFPEEKTPQAMADDPEIDVTPATIRNWCDRGQVDHRRTPGGRYFVKVESCLEYARSQ